MSKLKNSNQDALIFAPQTLEIQFQMSRPLTDFMATLHKNGMDEKKLSKYVTHKISGDIVTLTVTFPEEGQYGMDIYTRELRDGRTKMFVAVESFSYKDQK